MTRESKIALLVGLGFIICFGVIISGSRDDQDAKVAGAVDMPLDPGSDRAVERTPLMALYRGPQRMTPVTQVPIAVDYVIPRQVEPSEPAPVAPRQTLSMQPYTVKPGDSLIRIAKAVYGPSHGDQYMRIFEANRDVMSDPSIVIPGKTLRIPPLADAPVVTYDQPAVASTDHGSAGRTYTVQRGDTMTAIARRTMGSSSGAAVRALHELNRQAVPNPNRLRVGTVLQIPR